MDENKSYIPEQNVYQNTQYNPNQPYQPYQPYNPQNNQPYQQPYGQPARATVYDTMPMKNNNMAIAGLIVGIFALIGFWVPFFDVIMSIIGIVCSSIGIAKQGKASGMSIAGLVISILALLLGIVFMIIYFIALMI